MQPARTLDLFCRVVDNFGDIGVCWRLARQLAAEHPLAVTLWVDDLASFKRICNAVDIAQARQSIAGVAVRAWSGQADAAADIVVEGFGCALPPAYLAAMAQRPRAPAWINLEYLSAERWVEGCHRMPSPHPALPLTKYFFFPGFTAATGGLMFERDLQQRRDRFQQDPARVQAWFDALGIDAAPDVYKLSLFCYPDAPVDALFAALQSDARPALCLVPEGVAAAAVARFLEAPARAGAFASRGALTVHVIPFLDQDGYDHMLWACDFNFVRGEDSVVRAQWAGRPFAWQIYPQEEDAHMIKLDAFLARFEEGLAPPLGPAWHAWNGRGDFAAAWPALRARDAQIRDHLGKWTDTLRRNGALASNLLEFAGKIG